MSDPIGPSGGRTANPAGNADERLHQLASNLEGVFVGQLFKAMRAGVPNGGMLEASTGQDTFTSMLDDRLAELAAQRLQHGMGDALYRQLSRRLAPADPTSAIGSVPLPKAPHE
ncbi:MAG: rod-binding protein [Gemmatimonadota bacterium]